MNRDEIRIDNLEVFAYHGVAKIEKENGQPFCFPEGASKAPVPALAKR
mgnify:CR=1 FL=1